LARRFVPRSGPARACFAFLVASCLALSPAAGRAHDPSSWGGLFRSRDAGATWFLASQGRFVGGALALAISPNDPNNLLLASDSGLLWSVNGGRDWDSVAGDELAGSVFAVAFDADGRRALAATAWAIARTSGRGDWEPATMPVGAAPIGGLVSGGAPGVFYLAGFGGIFRTGDSGEHWVGVGDGLPAERPVALVAEDGPMPVLYALVGGRVFRSTADGRAWQPCSAGLPAGQITAVAADREREAVLWAAGAGRVFRSDDRGATWRPFGQPLPEPDTEIRGIGVRGPGPSVLVSTQRGLYRWVDDSHGWMQLADNLPAHLEAGPLVADPVDPSTLYAGFSLTPYDELWRTAAERRPSTARLGAGDLAGAGAVIMLLGLGAAAALRRLARARAADPGVLV
jgi:hypothetical protein